jgi:deoxyribonuclease-4
MIYTGSHLSASKGYLSMGKKALELGENTFAFFTRNPRGGKARKIEQQDVDALLKLENENGFGKLVAHAPYTMNLCSGKENVAAFSANMLRDDMQRMEFTPGNYYNFHPGSHVGQGAEKGIEMIADALNDAMFEGQQTIVLLETMSGKGSEVGRNFQELREIIDRVNIKDKIGVCFDTCHVWDGGYDIVNHLDDVLTEFDKVIGLDRLCAVHFNDSKNDLGARKDRHEKLGEGKIGLEALRRVALHPVLQDKPFILETPNDDAGYAAEIKLMNSWF